MRVAGRDATLLVLRSDLSAYDNVRNLTLENCTIEACTVFEGTRSGATLVFVDCTMRDISDYKHVVPRHARLLGTEVQWHDGRDRDALKRDLNDIFPGWRAELKR